jgi:hypothetical protein
VRVAVEWGLAEGVLQGRIVDAAFPDGMSPAALAFPEVSIAYDGCARWVIPSDIGLIAENPLAEQVEADASPSVALRKRMHMQFTAWLAEETGLYLDSRDTEGWIKSVLLRVGGGCAALGIEHSLPQPVSGEPDWPRYPVSITAFAGDWYEASRIYRPWALAQHWAARGPEQRRDSYVAEIACWLWNRGRIDNVCPATKEVARRLGLPVALDWYWWHKKPYDSGYPDYFPPREGNAAFRAAVEDLQENNVAVQVYTNGMSWDRDEPDWESRGKQCTLVLQNGEYYGHIYNTWMNAKLMHTCGASEVWHDQALITARKAAELGLDGLYIDQIGVIGGMIPCFSTEHGHVPGGGCYGVQGFRKMFSKIREQQPGLVLSSESVGEFYQDLLECSITLQTSWERSRGEQQCRNVYPIPLFQAVYHGHAVVFGNYSHIDGMTPYDELWPQEKRTDPADEKPWHRICPDQFPLDVARTVAFGCQPLTSNLTMKHLNDPEYADDVAFFLELARFYHAYREWLLWGDMLAPGTINAQTHSVTCIQRGIFTPPESIVPFNVVRPTVLHSAWRAPDGHAGIVLINYSRTEQSVNIERDDDLRPADGAAERTLPARSTMFVPLA